MVVKKQEQRQKNYERWGSYIQNRDLTSKDNDTKYRSIKEKIRLELGPAVNLWDFGLI